ncbi:MAG: hypothetical protein ABIG96_04835 [Candidatus Micrarchaeota archaeon]
MAISKTGVASLLLGIFLVAVTAYFGFPGATLWAIIGSTILGGLMLLGLFLMLIGALMLVI